MMDIELSVDMNTTNLSHTYYYKKASHQGLQDWTHSTFIVVGPFVNIVAPV